MNDTVITFDIDWAPECAIDFVAERLISDGICATWFITHNSPAISRLKQYPHFFELGIHPNFLPGSTHGENPEAVLRHSLSLVPDAVSMRSHALVQSTPLFDQILRETPIINDVSLFLPYGKNLGLIEYRRARHTLIRVPYFWEDDFEMENEPSCWDLPSLLNAGNGLKVFNFHPIHIYLNSSNNDPYRNLKDHAPRLADATQNQVSIYRCNGIGTYTVFDHLVAYLKETKQSLRVDELCNRWRKLKNECLPGICHP